MHFLAALVLAAAPAPQAAPPVEHVVAERQAQAMVRILPGAQLRFAELEKTAPESFRDTQIRASDGSLEPARLVEFH